MTPLAFGAGEMYLRTVRDADCADPDSVEDLARLGIWAPLGNPSRDLGLAADAYSALIARFSAEIHDGALPGISDIEVEREPAYPDAFAASIGGVRIPVHVDEVALRARIIQRATDHIEAHQNGRPVRTAWRNCETEANAWEQFSRFSTAALRDFHVRLVIDDGSGDPEFARGDTYTTVYGVAWLQMVNDVAEGLPLLTCANATCRRTFVRQIGRAKYGQNRTEGVRFCSASCARAQAQRDYRHRRNEKGRHV